MICINHFKFFLNVSIPLECNITYASFCPQFVIVHPYYCPYSHQLNQWPQNKKSKGRGISASFSTQSQGLQRPGSAGVQQLMAHSHHLRTVTQLPQSATRAGTHPTTHQFVDNPKPLQSTPAPFYQPSSGAMQPYLSSAGPRAYPINPHSQDSSRPLLSMTPAQLFQTRLAPSLIPSSMPHPTALQFGDRPQPLQTSPAAQFPHTRFAPQPRQPYNAGPFNQPRFAPQPLQSYNGGPLNFPRFTPQPLQLPNMQLPHHRPAITLPTQSLLGPLVTSPIRSTQQLSLPPAALLHNSPHQPRPQALGGQHLPHRTLLPTPPSSHHTHPASSAAPHTLPQSLFSPSVISEDRTVSAPVSMVQIQPLPPPPQVAQRPLLLPPQAAVGLSRGPLLPYPSLFPTGSPVDLPPQQPPWNSRGIWTKTAASVSLQPVTSLVDFRFNKEAILNELHTR